MINTRLAVALLPLYVVAMIALDAIFNSAGVTTKGHLPLWLIVTFIVSALVVFAIAAWGLARMASGRIPRKREAAYIGILAGVIISGIIGEGLAALAWMVFDDRSIWLMIPIHILAYIAFFAVLVLALSRSGASPHAASSEKGQGN